MVWHIVRYWVTFFIPFFYKRVQVNSIEHLKVKGPVILAMNHPNAFTDAVAFTFIAHPIRTKYLARGDAFKPGLISWILEQIGIVPIFRLQDAGKEGLLKNQSTFRKVNQLLQKNAKLIVFAEGICVQERRIRPLKKGVARMVFGAFEALKEDNLIVLPVGLNYNQPDKFRSNLYYNIGEPINVKDFIEAFRINPAKAQTNFLQILEPKMKELINQINQKENDEVVYFYEDLCKRHMLLEQQLDYKNLKDDFFVTKQITEKVNSVAQNNQTILNEFKLKARDYFNHLKKHRIKDWLINPKLNQQVTFYNLYLYFFIVTLFFPLYAIGIIGNYGPYLSTKKLTRKIAKNKEFYSSIAIALGMIFFLINYLVWFFVIYLFSANIFFPLFICFLFIMSGWFSLHYHQFKAKTFGMWRILKDKNLYNQFVLKRNELINLINAF